MDLTEEVICPHCKGNAVYNNDPAPYVNIFGKLFFVAFLVGITAYMYFKHE